MSKSDIMVNNFDYIPYRVSDLSQNWKDVSSCFENASSVADRSNFFHVDDDFLKSSALEVESFKNEIGECDPALSSSSKNLNDISIISCTAMN